MQKLLTWTRLPLLALGLVILFVAERYLAAEASHVAVRSLGMGLVVVSFLMTVVLSVTAAGRGHTAEGKAWRYAALWQIGLIVGLALFLAYRSAMGDAASPDTPMQKGLLGAWLVVFTGALFAGIGAEWAIRDNGRGANAEPLRVARSTGAWLLIGMLLSILTAVNYVANKKDVTRDWSYLKVTSPSPSTLGLLKSLTTDVSIALFYPQGNEVRQLAAEYFDKVAAAEKRVKVEYFDKDMAPGKAEEFRVSRNGQIVLDVGGKRSRIDTNTTLGKARKTLRSLDGEFQKALLEVTADKKTIYFTRGHGENSWVGDSGTEDPLKSIALLEGFLRQQNYTLKLFGVGDGSASAVPDDAAAVAIIGPTQPFQKEEVEALKAFVEKGGNLMVFLDLSKPAGAEASLAAPMDQDPLRLWLATTGLKYNEIPLANDKLDHYVVATRSPVDHWFIYSNVFTSHDSVVNLARNDERIAVLAFQSGYWTITPDSGQWKAFETVRSLSDTFADVDRDFKFTDGSEKRDSYVMGAVAELKNPPPNKDPKSKNRGGRIMAFGDATSITDGIIRNQGNALFFVDSLKWLAGESERSGEVASEEDVKIRHTSKEDAVWFHGTVVVVPLMVLGAGWLATRRKRGERDAPQQEKTQNAG